MLFHLLLHGDFFRYLGCLRLHVSRFVMGIREREAKSITERKNHLVSILADVATLGSERMAEKIGKAGLRDAAIGTGIAVDKMLALTGQMPALQIANIVMPTPEEREARDASHRRLDEITHWLRELPPAG